jgi:hypothetical protein
MTTKDLYKIFEIEDLSLLPSSIMESIFSEKRDLIYDDLLKLNSDLSFDWFQNIYEDELAQRNQNKQDFTPNSVGVLLSKLTGYDRGNIYEPTAGNGSLLIANWWYRKNAVLDFKPEEHPVECWELSSRSLPILLLNLSIRGIVGVVYHGDVLSKTIKCKYDLINERDTYSKIIKITQL